MTPLPDAFDVALHVARALEQVGAGYFVGGSFASSLDEWRDILGVLRARQSNLDSAYLRDWARRLGITDLLDRALSEVR